MGNQLKKDSYLSDLHPPPGPFESEVTEKQITGEIEINYRMFQTIQAKKPFQKQLKERQQQIQEKMLEDGFYQGLLNQKKVPEGYGMLYKKNGEIYIGKFLNGIAEKEGAYFFTDASWYSGLFQKGELSGKGSYYRGQKYVYQGQFKNSKFDGLGQQLSGEPDNEPGAYQFQGKFKNGKRTQGVLKWNSNYVTNIYNGTFNEDQKFHGHGTLKNEYGQYVGNFENGKKHGEGKFKHNEKNGILYVGQYKNGIRSGKGKLYHAIPKNQSEKNQEKLQLLAFEGQFQEGLPHGKGLHWSIHSKTLVQMQFNHGTLLFDQDQQQSKVGGSSGQQDNF